MANETSDEKERKLMEDGMLWGFMEDGKFIPLAKAVMIRGGFGPPPFTITLPDGRERHVVSIPDGSGK
jgi:hypothetical protein